MDLGLRRKFARKTVTRVRKFQSLKVIGIKKLENAFVWLVSNLIAKRYCLFENGVFRANKALNMWDY